MCWNKSSGWKEAELSCVWHKTWADADRHQYKEFLWMYGLLVEETNKQKNSTSPSPQQQSLNHTLLNYSGPWIVLLMGNVLTQPQNPPSPVAKNYQSTSHKTSPTSERCCWDTMYCTLAFSTVTQNHPPLKPAQHTTGSSRNTGEKLSHHLWFWSKFSLTRQRVPRASGTPTNWDTYIFTEEENPQPPYSVS